MTEINSVSIDQMRSRVKSDSPIMGSQWYTEMVAKRQAMVDAEQIPSDDMEYRDRCSVPESAIMLARAAMVKKQTSKIEE